MALVFRSSSSSHTASGTSVSRNLTGQDGTNRLYVVSVATSSVTSAIVTVTDDLGAGTVWYRVGGYAGLDPRRSIWCARVGGFSNFTVTVTADTTCKLSVEFSIFSGTVPAPPYFGQGEVSDAGSGTSVATSAIVFTDYFIALALLTSATDFTGATPDAPFQLFEAVTDPATGVPYAAFYDNAPTATESLTATLGASASWDTLAVGVTTTSPPPPPTGSATNPTRSAPPALPGFFPFVVSPALRPTFPGLRNNPVVPSPIFSTQARRVVAPPRLPGSPFFFLAGAGALYPPLAPAPPPAPPSPPVPTGAAQNLGLVTNVPDPRDQGRLRIHLQQVTDLLNALIRKGVIVKTGQGDWDIDSSKLI